MDGRKCSDEGKTLHKWNLSYPDREMKGKWSMKTEGLGILLPGEKEKVSISHAIHMYIHFACKVNLSEYYSLWIRRVGYKSYF